MKLKIKLVLVNKNSGEVLSKLKCRGFRATSLSTYDFSTLYTILPHLVDNIYIRFGTKSYRKIVGIPMGTNCAPLVADLFLYCYERDFMDSLNQDDQAHVIDAFNSTSRYLDDLLDIDSPYFEGMAFDKVNFPFLDGVVPCRASYGVYISQLFRFARVYNHVTDSLQRSK